MRLKTWQWIIIGVIVCAWLTALIVLGAMLLNQSRAAAKLAIAGGTPPLTPRASATPAPTHPPTPTATPTPRPTHTRVVLNTPAAGAAQTPAAPTPSPEDYFPLAAGYWWAYQNDLGERVERIVKETQIVDGQVYYIMLEQVGEAGAPGSYVGEYRYLLQSNAVLLENLVIVSGQAKGYVYGPFLPVIKIPFSSWNAWSWSGRRFDTGGAAVDLKLRWEAYPEKVHLPAGTFDTYRVMTFGEEAIIIDWYAPGVGLVEQSVAGAPRRSFKLVEYGLGQ